MSIENRPNLHAVELTLSIIMAIDESRRGRAGEAYFTDILDLIQGPVIDFVDLIDATLDKHYPLLGGEAQEQRDKQRMADITDYQATLEN